MEIQLMITLIYLKEITQVAMPLMTSGAGTVVTLKGLQRDLITSRRWVSLQFGSRHP